MDITGKIIDIVIGSSANKSAGETQNGKWRVDQIILEYGDEHKHNAVIEVFSNESRPRMKEFGVSLGQTVRLYYDFDARKGSSGRWFQGVRAYKVEHVSETMESSMGKEEPIPQPIPQPTPQQVMDQWPEAKKLANAFDAQPVQEDLPF